MKRLLCGLVGLLAGGYLSTLVGAGCSCPPGPRTIPKFAAGTYKVSRNMPQDLGAEADYRLVINPDQTLVTETFTRNGVPYENQYRITGTAGN